MISLGLFFMASCNDSSSSSEAIEINGVEKNGKNQVYYLDDINGNVAVTLDTSEVNNGKFTLNAQREPGIYRVRTVGDMGRYSWMAYLDGSSDIKLNVDLNKPMEYEMTGNAESEFLTTILHRQNEFAERSQEMQNALRTPLTNEQRDSVSRALQALVVEAGTAVKASIEESKSMDADVSAFLLNLLDPRAEKSYITATLAELSKKDKESRLIQQMSKRFIPAPARNSGVAIGAVAPEIRQKTPDGDMMALSDLRGKYVLIDFWASWCRPCRIENPNVVRTYHKYKGSGFDIFSVSLDKSEPRWIKAIEDDGLVWDGHVSDLKAWSNQAARDYGVGSIPATFLIDPEGKVIARNLRGGALERKLQEVLGEG